MSPIEKASICELLLAPGIATCEGELIVNVSGLDTRFQGPLAEALVELLPPEVNPAPPAGYVAVSLAAPALQLENVTLAVSGLEAVKLDPELQASTCGFGLDAVKLAAEPLICPATCQETWPHPYWAGGVNVRDPEIAFPVCVIYHVPPLAPSAQVPVTLQLPEGADGEEDK